MKQRTINLLLAIVATLGLAVCAGLVYGLGSVLYEDPSTMRSIPKKTAAGYIATADGGVVNVMSGPAPTAVGQALRTTSIGTGTNQSVAAFTSDPVATTTGKGVVQLGTSARLSATTVTTTASTISFGSIRFRLIDPPCIKNVRKIKVIHDVPKTRRPS